MDYKEAQFPAIVHSPMRSTYVAYIKGPVTGLLSVCWIGGCDMSHGGWGQEEDPGRGSRSIHLHFSMTLFYESI